MSQGQGRRRPLGHVAPEPAREDQPVVVRERGRVRRGEHAQPRRQQQDERPRVHRPGTRPESRGDLWHGERRHDRSADDHRAVQVRPQGEDRQHEIDAARRLSKLVHQEPEHRHEERIGERLRSHYHGLRPVRDEHRQGDPRRGARRAAAPTGEQRQHRRERRSRERRARAGRAAGRPGGRGRRGGAARATAGRPIAGRGPRSSACRATAARAGRRPVRRAVPSSRRPRELCGGA